MLPTVSPGEGVVNSTALMPAVLKKVNLIRGVPTEADLARDDY